MKKTDRLECGCYWERYSSTEPLVVGNARIVGDVLRQCETHRTGAVYAGSEISVDDFEDLVAALRDGLDVGIVR